MVDIRTDTTHVSEPVNNTILETMPRGIHMLDARCRTQLWNARAEKLTGIDRQSVLGHRCTGCLDHNGLPLCLVRCPAVATLHDGKVRTAHVLRQLGEGRPLLPLELRLLPVLDEDRQIKGVMELLHPDTFVPADVIERATNACMIDRLTELPNRKAMRLCLDGWLSEDFLSAPFGVILLSVDNLAAVEAQAGLEAGGLLLRTAARTLKNHTRAYDVVTRWAMERLIALLPVHDEPGLIACANRILTVLQSHRIPTDAGEFEIVASAGCTLAQPGDTALEMVSRAEHRLHYEPLCCPSP